MGIHYDYKSTKGNKLMEKQAKREKKLAEKKADTPSKNVPVATSDQVSPQAVETDIQPKPIESLVDIGQQAQKRLEEINVRFDSEVEELESAIAQISSESKKAELFNKKNPEQKMLCPVY